MKTRKHTETKRNRNVGRGPAPSTERSTPVVGALHLLNPHAQN